MHYPPRIATTIVVGLLVGACASASSPRPVTTPPPSVPASSSSASGTPGLAGSPTAPPSFPSSPASTMRTARGSAAEVGALTAPGPGGTLYVLIDATVLARLDRSGQPMPGWPIRLPTSLYCWLLLPVDDGSVRLVCNRGEPYAVESTPLLAFAFDPGGKPLAGWPVDLPCCSNGPVIGRVMGDTLTVFTRHYRGDTADSLITWIAADGTLRIGERVTDANCCIDYWAVGPDGVAYGVVLHLDEAGVRTTSDLTAVGRAGVPAGFPVVIKGIASVPAFDAAGRIHVTVASVTAASPYHGPARTLVFDSDGRAFAGGSGDLGFISTDECVGIEGSCEGPGTPLVGADGTTFVIGAYFDSTTAAAVSPSGEVMAGWPYRSNAGHQGKGRCPATDVCEGFDLTAPAIGPGNVIYLMHAAADPSVGGSIVAIGQDGRVRPGWPVKLKRPGAEFWSVVVGSDGTAYALAVEPESGDDLSATILAIAPDSTVRYTTTIIEP